MDALAACFVDKSPLERHLKPIHFLEAYLHGISLYSQVEMDVRTLPLACCTLGPTPRLCNAPCPWPRLAL